MQLLEEYKSDMKKLKTLLERGVDYRTVAAILAQSQYILKDYPDERRYCFAYSDFVKKMALREYAQTLKPQWDELYWQAMLWEAPELFESYLFYMEKNRAQKRKFYTPRRRTLKTVVDDLQDLEDGEIEFYGLSLPPRVGKSTMCIFFISWIMGKRPNSHNAMSGHSGILADGFYGEILNLIMTQEYTFHEIFPLAKLDKKSADKKEINLDKPDRFATLTCRGIDGTWTGSVDISSDGYLYVDDLVRDRTESLSPTRLANRYQDYLNVLVDRKNDGAKELMVGTRWNVFDPLGVVERENKHNPRYRFRKIPALNENDESNFDYDYGVGFSTKYYIDMRERLEKPEWMAKFQQNPFVREGLLFPENELHYFDGTIPEGNYKIVAAIDPAFGGGDSVSMPICLVHENGKKYIIDWMHNKGSLKITIPLVRDKIMRHDVVEVKFEKNNGGELYCKNVQVDLVDRKYNHCHCYTKSAPVRLSKEEKINAYADYIKDNFLFLLPNRNISIDNDGVRFVYKRSDEYDKAIDEMTMYTSEGRNEHDDSCDALTQLAMMFEDKFTAPPAQVINSPF